MGERKDEPLRVQFDPQVRLDFAGSKISTDAGLMAYGTTNGSLIQLYGAM
ncbi:MAG: hypothetical protein ABFE07_19365 [Armatimonadia bacterium]